MANPLITRFALAAAAAGVQIDVPKCSIPTGDSENCKTNPTEHSGTSPALPSPFQGEGEIENCKTKPTEHSGTSALSNRQLAAVRYLARGRGSVETARKLGVTRQTVARWWHHPAFAAEVQRLHERLTRAAVAPRREMR